MTSEILFNWHLNRVCASSRSKLRSIIQTMDGGEMLDPSLAEVQGLILKLKAYLAEHDIHDVDDFVLCYGLSESNAYSKRRLEQAKDGVVSLLELLAMAELFPDMSEQDVPTKFRTLLDRSMNSPKRDAGWIAAHAALSEEDAMALSLRAVEFFASPRKRISNLGEDLLEALANFRPNGLGSVSELLAQRQIFQPPSAYRDATAGAEEKLRIFLIPENGEAITDVLFALAWIRSDSVKRDFSLWADKRPEWAHAVRWDLAEIPRFAGWEVDKDGTMRELMTHHCHLLMPSEGQESGGVPCRIPLVQDCPKCRSAMSWLFDFSLLPSAVLQPFGNAPTKVLCCFHCSVFEPFYASYSNPGDPVYLHSDCSHFDELADYPPSIRRLADKAVSPFSLSGCFPVDDTTALGGIPAWVQQPDFPSCHSCKRSMKFLAQFDGSGMDEEGTFYSFYCPDCSISAVNYQQT